MGYIDHDELEDIKRQVDRKLWRRGLMGAHLILWLIGCGIVGLVSPNAVRLVAPVWFGLVLLHGLFVLLWERREAWIRAEVERRVQGSGEKPKRSGRYRLTDDGELVDADEPLADAPAKKFRR